MSRPTRRQIAQQVAAATDELYKEGVLDEWGAGFGHTLAANILKGGKRDKKAKQPEQPQVQAAE